MQGTRGPWPHPQSPAETQRERHLLALARLAQDERLLRLLRLLLRLALLRVRGVLLLLGLQLHEVRLELARLLRLALCRLLILLRVMWAATEGIKGEREDDGKALGLVKIFSMKGSWFISA